jgi:hypothetical protein
MLAGLDWDCDRDAEWKLFPAKVWRIIATRDTERKNGEGWNL